MDVEYQDGGCRVKNRTYDAHDKRSIGITSPSIIVTCRAGVDGSLKKINQPLFKLRINFIMCNNIHVFETGQWLSVFHLRVILGVEFQ